MLVSVHLDREPAEDKLPALGKRGLASVHLDRLGPGWGRVGRGSSVSGGRRKSVLSLSL